MLDGSKSSIEEVALRKESVDRNRLLKKNRPSAGVALRKESVDRNHDNMLRYRDAEQSLSARRAWIEICRRVLSGKRRWSLSARRAWIEIEVPEDQYTALSVALRKESVDRNRTRWEPGKSNGMSLSARRAWIEIVWVTVVIVIVSVALRKESVDRNQQRGDGRKSVAGRSPQGERG